MAKDNAPSQVDIERAAVLREQVAYHLHRYHVLDTPEIADPEFDALFDGFGRRTDARGLSKGSPSQLAPSSSAQVMRIGNGRR